jgi:hypothetical protein
MKKLLAIALGVALAGAATVALAGRDSSGTMTFNSVAGGYPFQPGVISRSAMNTHLAEIAAELTDSASRSGKGGFSAPVRTADGSASLPAFSWSLDTNTGLYRIGTDNIGIALGGVKKVDLSLGAASFTDPASFLGSTTTSGIARFPGGVSGSTSFNDAVSFASSVTIPTPLASTDAASKGYVDSVTNCDSCYSTALPWTVSEVRIRKTVSGFVFFSALIAQGASQSTPALQLGIGFRPGDIEAPTRLLNSGSDCNLHLNTAGQVTPVSGSCPINSSYRVSAVFLAE